MPPIQPDELEPGMNVVYAEGGREWEGTVLEVAPRIVRLELHPPVHLLEGPDFFDKTKIREEDVLPEVTFLSYSTARTLQRLYQLPPGRWTERGETRQIMWALDEPLPLKTLQGFCRETAIEPDDPNCWIHSSTVRVWPVTPWRGKWTPDARVRGVKEWRPGQRPPEMSGAPTEETLSPKDLRPGVEATYKEFDHEYPGRILDVGPENVLLELAAPVHYMDAPYGTGAMMIEEGHYLPESFAAHPDTMLALQRRGISPQGEWVTSPSGIRLFRFETPVPIARIR